MVATMVGGWRETQEFQIRVGREQFNRLAQVGGDFVVGRPLG